MRDCLRCLWLGRCQSTDSEHYSNRNACKYVQEYYASWWLSVVPISDRYGNRKVLWDIASQMRSSISRLLFPVIFVVSMMFWITASSVFDDALHTFAKSASWRGTFGSISVWTIFGAA